MHSKSESKKRPYSPPSVRKLTLEEAKKIVACHANCSHQKAAELLELLRRQLQRKEK